MIVDELFESMGSFMDLVVVVSCLKFLLYVLFELYYLFDLDFFKKENFGKVI